MDINYDEDDNKIHFRLRLQAQEMQKQNKSVSKPAVAAQQSHEDVFVVNLIDPTTITPFNHAIFAAIRDWAQQPLSGIRSFYQTWTKWQAHMITETTLFNEIQQVLGIKNLQEYAMTVKQCPAVEWIFDITWDPVNESIVWKFRDEPLTPQYQKKTSMEKPVPKNAAINTTEEETLQQLAEYH
jgi:hypothetical protein